MKNLFCAVGLTLALGCASAVVRPYVGEQQAWPTSSGSILISQYPLPVFTSLPPAPYNVLGELRLNSPFYAVPEPAHFPVLVRAASKLNADALILVDGQEFFSSVHVARPGVESGTHAAVTAVNRFNPDAIKPGVAVLAIKWTGDPPAGLPAKYAKNAPIPANPAPVPPPTTETPSSSTETATETNAAMPKVEPPAPAAVTPSSSTGTATETNAAMPKVEPPAPAAVTPSSSTGTATATNAVTPKVEPPVPVAPMPPALVTPPKEVTPTAEPGPAPTPVPSPPAVQPTGAVQTVEQPKPAETPSATNAPGAEPGAVKPDSKGPTASNESAAAKTAAAVPSAQESGGPSKLMLAITIPLVLIGTGGIVWWSMAQKKKKVAKVAAKAAARLAAQKSATPAPAPVNDVNLSSSEPPPQA